MGPSAEVIGLRLIPIVCILLIASTPITALPLAETQREGTPLDIDAGLVPQAPGTGPMDATSREDRLGREMVRGLAQATPVNDATGNKLFDDLEQRFLLAGPYERLPVIVTGTEGTDADSLVQKAQQQVGRDFEPLRVYSFLPGFLAGLTLTEALQVAGLDGVRQLEYNRVGEPELGTATVYSGARAANEQLNITGDLDGDPSTFTTKDVSIAVLDTGVDGGHVDLSDGKIVASYDAGREEFVDPVDSGTHGTHVASIAAGLGIGNEDYRGVAPGAGIVNIQISGTDGSTTDNVLHALEWAIENKDRYNIRVLTMSFGFGQATDGTTAMELAFDKAWDAGIVTFKSAGNSGPERTTITVPGAARGILSVGAMLDPSGIEGGLSAEGVELESDLTNQAGFSLASFSSRGPTTDARVKPDIVAPGWSVTAAFAGSGDGYATFSGTSMAAPFAAGTAALVISANPELTPDEVRGVLRGSAEDWGIEGADVDYGWGRLDSLSAVAWALTLAGETLPPVEPPMIPRHEVRMGTLDETGRATEQVTLNATGSGMAMTYINEGRAVSIQVFLDDLPLTESAANSVDASRHMLRGFMAPEPGTYTVELLGTPFAAYSLDIAHSETVRAPLAAFDPERFAAASQPPPEAPAEVTPGPGLLLIAGLVFATALVAALRRRGD